MIDFSDAPQGEGLNWPDNCFRLALQTLNSTFKDPTIVEIGTLREGQGCSSEIFAWYVSKYGGSFRTCDINPKSTLTFISEYVVKKKLVGTISSIAQDGVEYLKGFSDPIHFLYLDSMDCGKGMLSFQSSLHHASLFIEAQRNLHPNSLILIDDILPGTFHFPIDENSPNLGKGLLLIPYLLSQDKTFKCLHRGYQYLFQVI